MEEEESKKEILQSQNKSRRTDGIDSNKHGTSKDKNVVVPAVRESCRARKKSKRVLESADFDDEEMVSIAGPKKHKRRKKDFFNGQPFKCSLCESVQINNCSSRTKLKKQDQPVRKERDGTILYLCVKCALAVGQTENKGPTPEQRAEFEAEGKKFALQLSEDLGDPAATRLYCSFYQLTKCGCVQNYIEGRSVSRKRKTSISSTNTGSTEKPTVEEEQSVPGDNATRLERGKFFLSLLKESQSKRKSDGGKKQRNKTPETNEAEGEQKTKLEKFILEERVKLKEMGICERGCQKVLCYSNNFLHKKSVRSEVKPRLQRTKGRAALGRLDPLSELPKMKCCDKMCVKMAEENQAKVERWRHCAQGSRKEMWQVIHEMLSPSDPANSYCQKFICMVTGRCVATVQKVYGQSLLSRGKIGNPEHGLKGKKQRELSMTPSSTFSSTSRSAKKHENNIFILNTAASLPKNNPSSHHKETTPSSQLPELSSPLVGNQLLGQQQKPAVDPAKHILGLQQPSLYPAKKGVGQQLPPASDLTKELIANQQPAVNFVKQVPIQQQSAFSPAKQVVVQQSPQVPLLPSAPGVLTFMEQQVQAFTPTSPSVPSVSTMISVDRSRQEGSSKISTSYMSSQAKHSPMSQHADSRLSVSQEECEENGSAETVDENEGKGMSQEVKELQVKVGKLKEKETAAREEIKRLSDKLDSPQALENLKECINLLSEIQKDLKTSESRLEECQSSVTQMQKLPGTKSETTSQFQVSTDLKVNMTPAIAVTSTSTMQDPSPTSSQVTKNGRPFVHIKVPQMVQGESRANPAVPLQLFGDSLAVNTSAGNSNIIHLVPVSRQLYSQPLISVGNEINGAVSKTGKTLLTSQPFLTAGTKTVSQALTTSGHLSNSHKQANNALPLPSVPDSGVSVSSSEANNILRNMSLSGTKNGTPHVIGLQQIPHPRVDTNQNPSSMPQIFAVPVTGLQQSLIQLSMPQISQVDNCQVNLMTPAMQQSSLTSSQTVVTISQPVTSDPTSHSKNLNTGLPFGNVVTVLNTTNINDQQLKNFLPSSFDTVNDTNTVNQSSNSLPILAIQKGTPAFDPSQQTQISVTNPSQQLTRSSVTDASQSSSTASQSNIFQDTQMVAHVSNTDQNLHPSLLTLLPSSVSTDTQPHSSGFFFDALADSPVKDSSVCPPISQPVSVISQSIVSNPKPSLLCEMLMSPTGPPFSAISTSSSLQFVSSVSHPSSLSLSVPNSSSIVTESQKNRTSASSVSMNLNSLAVSNLSVPTTGISNACQSLNFETNPTPSLVLTQSNTENQNQQSSITPLSSQNLSLTHSHLKASRSQRTRELQIGIVHPHVSGGTGITGKKSATCSSTNSNNYSRFSLGNVAETHPGTSRQVQSFSGPATNGQTGSQRCIPNIQEVEENQSYRTQPELQQEQPSTLITDNIPVSTPHVSHPSPNIQTSVSGWNTEVQGSTTLNSHGVQNANTLLQSIQNLPNIFTGGGLQSSGHQVLVVVSPGTGNFMVEPMTAGSSNSFSPLLVPQNDNDKNISLPLSVGNNLVQNSIAVSRATQNNTSGNGTAQNISFNNSPLSQGNVSLQPHGINNVVIQSAATNSTAAPVPLSSPASAVELVSLNKPLVVPVTLSSATVQPDNVNRSIIYQNNNTAQPMNTKNIAIHQVSSRDVTMQQTNVSTQAASVNNASIQSIVLNSAMLQPVHVNNSTAQPVINGQTIFNLAQNGSAPILLPNLATQMPQTNVGSHTQFQNLSGPYQVTANVQSVINSGPQGQQVKDSLASQNSTTVTSTIGRFESQSTPTMANESLIDNLLRNGTKNMSVAKPGGKGNEKTKFAQEPSTGSSEIGTTGLSNVGISADPSDLLALLNQAGHSQQLNNNTGNQIAADGPGMRTLLAGQHPSSETHTGSDIPGLSGSVSQLSAGVIHRSIAGKTLNGNLNVIEGIQALSSSPHSSQQLLPIQVLNLGQIQASMNNTGQILQVGQDTSLNLGQPTMQTLSSGQQIVSVSNTSASNPVFLPLQSMLAQSTLKNIQGIQANQQIVGISPVLLTSSTSVSSSPGVPTAGSKTPSTVPQVTKNTATPVTFTSAQPSVANSGRQITSTASNSNKHRSIRPKLPSLVTQVKPTPSTLKKSFILVPDKPGFPAYQLGDNINPNILSSLVGGSQSLQIEPLQQHTQTGSVNLGVQLLSSNSNVKPNTLSSNTATHPSIQPIQSIEANTNLSTGNLQVVPGTSCASSSICLAPESQSTISINNIVTNTPNNNTMASHNTQYLNLQQLCVQNGTVLLKPQQASSIEVMSQSEFRPGSVSSSSTSSVVFGTTAMTKEKPSTNPVSNGTFPTSALPPQVSLGTSGSSYITLLNTDPNNPSFVQSVSTQILPQVSASSVENQIFQNSIVKRENEQTDSITKTVALSQRQSRSSDLPQPNDTMTTSLSLEISPQTSTTEVYDSLLLQKALEEKGGQGTANVVFNPAYQHGILATSQPQNGVELSSFPNLSETADVRVTATTHGMNSSDARLVTANISKQKGKSVKLEETATSFTQPISMFSLQPSSHLNQNTSHHSGLPAVETIVAGDQTGTSSCQLMLHLSKPLVTSANCKNISQQQNVKDTDIPITYLQSKEVIDLTSDSPPTTPAKKQRTERQSQMLLRPVDRQAPRSTLLYEELQKNSQTSLPQTDSNSKTTEPVNQTGLLQTAQQVPQLLHQALPKPEQCETQRHQYNLLNQQQKNVTSGEMYGGTTSISGSCENQGGISSKDIIYQVGNSLQKSRKDETVYAQTSQHFLIGQEKQNNVPAVLSLNNTPNQAIHLDRKSSDNTCYQIACQNMKGDGATSLITLDEIPVNLRQELIASLEAHAAGNPDVQLETRPLNQSDDFSCRNIFPSTETSQQAELQMNEISKAIGNSMCPSAVVTISTNHRFKQSLGKIKSQAVLDTKTSLASEAKQGLVLGANTANVKPSATSNQFDMLLSSSTTGLPFGNQIVLHNVSLPSLMSSIPLSSSQILVGSSTVMSSGYNRSTQVASSTTASPATTPATTVSSNTPTNRPSNTPVTSSPVTFLRATHTPTDAVGPPNITIIPPSVTNAAQLLRLRPESSSAVGSLTSNTLTSVLNFPLMVQPEGLVPAARTLNPKIGTFTLTGTLDSQTSASTMQHLLQATQTSSPKHQGSAENAKEKTSMHVSSSNLLLTLTKGSSGHQSTDSPTRKKAERRRPPTIRDLFKSESQQRAAAAAQNCPSTSTVAGPLTYVLPKSAGASGLLVVNPSKGQDTAGKNLLDITVKNVQCLTRGRSNSKDGAISSTVNSSFTPTGFTLLHPSALKLLKEDRKPSNQQEKQSPSASQSPTITALTDPIILTQSKDQVSPTMRNLQDTQQQMLVVSANTSSDSGSVSNSGSSSTSSSLSTPLAMNTVGNIIASSSLMVKSVALPHESHSQAHFPKQKPSPQQRERDEKPQVLTPISVSVPCNHPPSNHPIQSMAQEDKSKYSDGSSELIGQSCVSSSILAPTNVSTGLPKTMSWAEYAEAADGQNLKFKTALRSGDQAFGSQIHVFHLPGNNQKEKTDGKEDLKRCETIRGMLSLNKNISPMVENKSFPPTVAESTPVAHRKEVDESSQKETISLKCPKLLQLMKCKSTNIQGSAGEVKNLLGPTCDRQMSLNSKVSQSPHPTEQLPLMNKALLSSPVVLHSDNRPTASKDERRETAQILSMAAIEADKTLSTRTSVSQATPNDHLYNRGSAGDERSTSLPSGNPILAKALYSSTGGNTLLSPNLGIGIRSSHLEKPSMSVEERMSQTGKAGHNQERFETHKHTDKLDSRYLHGEKEMLIKFSSGEIERGEIHEHLYQGSKACSEKAAYSDTHNENSQFPFMPSLPPRYEVAARDFQRLNSAQMKRPPPDYEDVSQLQHRRVDIKRPKMSLDLSTNVRAMADNSQSCRIEKVIDDIYRFPDEGEELSPPPLLSGSKFQSASEKLNCSYPPASHVEETGQVASQSQPSEESTNLQKQKYYRDSSEDFAQAAKKTKTRKQSGKSSNRFNPKKVQFSDVVTAQEFSQPALRDVPVSQNVGHGHEHQMYAIETFPERNRTLQPRHHSGHDSQGRHHSHHETFERHHSRDRHPPKSKSTKLKALLLSPDESTHPEEQHSHSVSQINSAQYLLLEGHGKTEQVPPPYNDSNSQRNNESLGFDASLNHEGSRSYSNNSFFSQGVSKDGEPPTLSGIRHELEFSNQHSGFHVLPQSRKADVANNEVGVHKRDFMDNKTQMIGEQLRLTNENSYTENRTEAVSVRQEHVSQASHVTPALNTDRELPQYERPSSFHILSSQGYSKLSRQRLARMPSDQSDDLTPTHPEAAQVSGVTRGADLNLSSSSTVHQETHKNRPYQQTWDPSSDSSSSYTAQPHDEREPTQLLISRHKLLESDFELAQQMSQGHSHGMVSVSKEGRMDSQDQTNKHIFHPVRIHEGPSITSLHKDAEWTQESCYDIGNTMSDSDEYRNLPGTSSKVTSPIFSEQVEGHSNLEPAEDLNLIHPHLRKEICDYLKENQKLKKEISVKESAARENQRQRQLSSTDKPRSLIGDADDLDRAYVSPLLGSPSQMYALENTNLSQQRKKHPSSSTVTMGILKQSPLPDEMLKLGESSHGRSRHPSSVSSGVRPLLEQDNSWAEFRVRSNTISTSHLRNSNYNHDPTQSEILIRGQRDPLVSGLSIGRPSSQMDMEPLHYESTRHKHPSSDLKPLALRHFPEIDSIPLNFEIPRHRNLSSALGVKLISDLEPPPYDSSQRQRNPSASSIKSALDFDLPGFDFGTRSRNPSSSSWRTNYIDLLTDNSFNANRSRNPSGSSNRRSRPGSSSSDRELPINIDELPFFSDIAHTRSRNSSGDSIEPTIFLDNGQIMQLYAKQNRH